MHKALNSNSKAMDMYTFKLLHVYTNDTWMYTQKTHAWMSACKYTPKCKKTYKKKLGVCKMKTSWFDLFILLIN